MYLQHMLLKIREKTIWNLHFPSIMSIVFTSFKNPKLKLLSLLSFLSIYEWTLMTGFIVTNIPILYMLHQVVRTCVFAYP